MIFYGIKVTKKDIIDGLNRWVEDSSFDEKDYDPENSVYELLEYAYSTLDVKFKDLDIYVGIDGLDEIGCCDREYVRKLVRDVFVDVKDEDFIEFK